MSSVMLITVYFLALISFYPLSLKQIDNYISIHNKKLIKIKNEITGILETNEVK